MTKRSSARWASAVVLRGVALTLAWVALSGAEPEYAGYGAVSVAAALALSLWLQPPARLIRPLAGTALGLWFLGQSVLGGWDVTRRALRRRVDVEPVVQQVPFALPEGHARQLALLLMNLMPGTMVQRVGAERIGAEQAGTDQTGTERVGDEQRPGDDAVELHSLSASLGPAGQWEQLQRRVGAAFGVPVRG